MGKDIGHSLKSNISKMPTPTLMKPVLSSSANHTSYTTNSTRTIISSQLENEDSNAIQNTSNISNTDDIHSCVTPQKQNISVQATSTPPRLTPLITSLPLAPIELPKTIELPPFGKEYFCFRVNSKYPHAAQCAKSRVLKKFIDSILSIDKFEQQCVVIKCMFKSSRLEDHMKTNVIDQSSFTRSSFEYRSMNNIKKIYQHAGKWDDQQNLKDILEASLLSTTEGFTYNIPNVHMTSSPVKKLSARKSLCLFTNIWDVKPKTAKRRIVDVKSKSKVMKLGNSLWTQKKRKGRSKINEQIKRNLYTCIIRHLKVFQSPISNDCLKVMLDDQT